MKVVLYGATGNSGRRILNELVARKPHSSPPSHEASLPFPTESWPNRTT